MATATPASTAPISTGAPRSARRRPRTACTGRRHLTERTVTVCGGVQLAVRDQGPADAHATVVLLHGLCLDRDSWTGQIDHLTRQWGDRLRIISYDHRGHGKSDSAPKRTYTVSQLAEDLAGVLTALRVTGPLTLAGHSMGGMVALAYLGRPPADRPVEPTGLVLAATAAGRLTERGIARLLANPATNVLCGLAALTPHRALSLLSRPLYAALALRCDADARSTLSRLFTETSAAATTLDTAIGFLPGLRSFDQLSTLGSIRAETIVLSGGADVLTPPSHAHEMAAAILGAAHVHLSDAGHMLLDEAAHAVTAAVSRTIATRIGARPRSVSVNHILGQRHSQLAMTA
ncbi:alpha/beta hydrolase [Mycobacterium sp. CPCC 205372]|uniref:Alpha/beta hydrolase n=1 Tax=Mycobacterium hippophais TaxID=3016340 RepID=A0ABT4PU32_9MYCO|nr:alpha/beta hydrolase [Mycobacterium hippophais]MCZ8380084.1 alpha/beta hydrolase [Mycobacterium hippophais]